MTTPFIDVSPMTERERALLLLVWEHEAVTVQTVAQVMGISSLEVGQAAERLMRATFIRQERGRRVRVYVITDLGKLVASQGVTVYLVRHGRRRSEVPIMHLAGERVAGATVKVITDESPYLNEQTVQRHLQRVGLTGKPGRPRKEASA
jgi:hypothetical protein